MDPWRDVRNERQVLARFVDGPLAGTEQMVSAAPDGHPPRLVTPDDSTAPGTTPTVTYEFVEWA